MSKKGFFFMEKIYLFVVPVSESHIVFIILIE
jgi:hypothetical protein